MSSVTGIPFSFFCSLVREIGKIAPVQEKPLGHPPAAEKVFGRWIKELHRLFVPLPSNTTAICFRLLFPEEDTDRKYDIQENRMIHLLADCYGMDVQTFEHLGRDELEASGCLGEELRIVLKRSSSSSSDDGHGAISFSEVDQLLDELASKSGYSSKSIRTKYQTTSRSRTAIVRSLFRGLQPEEAAVLTQIILKDLRPLLYPLSEFHYTTALTRFNTASVKLLTKERAMDIWDPLGNFLRYYRVSPDMNAAAAHADQPSRPRVHISVGKLVTIPKSEKGRSCSHALSLLGDSEKIWAETKYDGERAQIHVELRNGRVQITIFSKSKRDSTFDRQALHSVIRSALDLNDLENCPPTIQQNVILDAEIVPFRGQQIGEFWAIRPLIEETARGPRSVNARNKERNSVDGLSLGLVFFDVLFLDSKSLMKTPYSQRRDILERMVKAIPGRCILSTRFLIEVGEDWNQPSRELAEIFAQSIARGEEGLILKAGESSYNDYKKPWVKIKRDYLPDAGDQLDFVLLGACWEKIRGRSLRVAPTTFTTFFIGAAKKLLQGDLTGLSIKRDAASSSKPKLYLYFTVSYGLTRDELEKLNFLMKNSDHFPYLPQALEELPYELEVLSTLTLMPTILLKTPLLVNLYGAGYTKSYQCQFYELRFPRIRHFYLRSERRWEEAPSLEEIQEIALNSLGRDRSDKDISDWAKVTWGQVASPTATSYSKQTEKILFWKRLLLELDGQNVMDPTDTSVSKKRKETSLIEEGRGLTRRKTEVNAPESESTNTMPDSSTLVWFARPSESDYTPCSFIGHWRKMIKRERRLHSLDSLLLCGGAIVVDECAESVDKWTKIIATRRQSGVSCPEILIYSCRSDHVVGIVE